MYPLSLSSYFLRAGCRHDVLSLLNIPLCNSQQEGLSRTYPAFSPLNQEVSMGIILPSYPQIPFKFYQLS